MIELELKFLLKSNLFEKFFNNMSGSRVVDEYYDTQSYDLLKGGNFLRNRNNKTIDFKLYAGDDSHLFCEETSFTAATFNGTNTGLLKTIKALNIDKTITFNTFDEFVINNQLTLLCKVDKLRKVLKLDNIIISLDKVENLGIFLEAEMHFDDTNFDKQSAQALIEKTLAEKGFIDLGQDKKVSIGYVELFLKRDNYEAYLLGKYHD